MTPWLDEGDVRFWHGDCVGVMRALPAASVDAIVTDPPYGIGFMNSGWDKPTGAEWGYFAGSGRRPSHREALDFQAFTQAWAVEALRILKPGGHAVAFGGTRTAHRLTAGIEDAGFEIRDALCWLYGSGFPKSKNLGDGRGTALKPAYEPIVLARKPLVGSATANVAAHGTGGLNIDACRIEHRDDAHLAESSAKNQHTRYANPGSNRDSYSGSMPPRTDYDGAAGRWPANVALDEEAAALVDEASGPRHPGASPAKLGLGSTRVYGDADRSGVEKIREQLDGGGASRFFYCAKASRGERNAGLEHLPAKPLHWSSGDQSPGTFQGDGTDRSSQNHHPTVKPVALMRWLVRLVTPPGGVLVDPFLGSGTTAIAARLEGYSCVGIEREEEYLRIAAGRLPERTLWAAV